MILDLHTHSTASDGQYTPSQLMDLAKKKMLEVVALTDHDTVDGIGEARERALEIGIPFVPGIEISTMEYEEVHMLGLGIDEKHPGLLQKTREFMEDRANRGIVICDYLRTKGVEVDYEEVLGLAGEGSVGRPHFAQYLQEHGYTKTRKEAFTRYIDTPSFHEATDRKLPSPLEAIELIHGAGGKAVLAHPGLLRKGKVKQEEFIKLLKENGLDGIEVFYSKHDYPQEKYYIAMAEKYELQMSAGSDFHGEFIKPEVKLGKQVKPQYSNIKEWALSL